MLAKFCDRLWFEGDLKNLIDSVEFIRTFLQNVLTSAVLSPSPSPYLHNVIPLTHRLLSLLTCAYESFVTILSRGHSSSVQI